MTCLGREKCLKCPTKSENCTTIYAAQRETLGKVAAGELKVDEALADMAERFPGKTIREEIRRQ
jgi:hypothetical protein